MRRDTGNSLLRGGARFSRNRAKDFLADCLGPSPRTWLLRLSGGERANHRAARHGENQTGPAIGRLCAALTKNSTNSLLFLCTFPTSLLILRDGTLRARGGPYGTAHRLRKILSRRHEGYAGARKTLESVQHRGKVDSPHQAAGFADQRLRVLH